MEEKRVVVGGNSFLGLLTIAFIVLKLVGEINWSWWWVLSPLWIPFAFGLGIALLVIFIKGVFAIIEAIRD